MDYFATFQKIQSIAGMHYRREALSDTLIIYGIGAPIPPDNGTLPDAPILMQFSTDIFVPDYIGYGRSDGKFTPENCIKTFIDLYEWFTKGCIVRNAYMLTEEIVRYKRIIFIGRSFGGTYIPLLPRYNPDIKELAIFCPVVDSKSCGSVKGEESNKDFLRSMEEDGYYHLYRGILHSRWLEHLENQDDLSPMENISSLKDCKLFIGHGKKDTCVHYSKSVDYFQEICQTFPNKRDQFTLQLYDNGGHGPSMTNQASKDFLEWLGISQIM